MSSGHEHNGKAGGLYNDAHHGPLPIPASLATPEIVTVWRTRLLIIAAIATLVSVLFAFTHEGRNHLLRAYLMAFMTCFGFAGGGLVVLMLQHVTGGKWGLLLRRSLEAMSRTMWLVALMFVPIAIFMKHLYQWAAYPNQAAVANALQHHWVTLEQAMTINDKHAMLNPVSVIVQSIIIFGVLLIFTYFLNKWSLQCDADPLRGTQASYDRWRTKFENLSGIGIFIYVVLLTAGSIDWIKSLDITWYSSIYGLQFLVGQGYAVLALGGTDGDSAVEVPANEDATAHDRTARPGQAHPRLRHAEHLSLLRGVSHYLVRQYSRRDSLVSPSYLRRMVGDLLA